MSDQAVGVVVVAGGVGVLLLAASIFQVVLGMTFTSIVFALSGLFVLADAKSAMHEITGVILLVGSALCAGIGGISKQLQKSNERLALPDSVATGLPFERKFGWKEPGSPRNDPKL